MFSKLNQLVKENIKNDVLTNAGIAEKDFNAFTSEAASSIVDVLKSQVDSGKAEDLLVFFKDKKVEQSYMVALIVNKFTHRLNKYYGLGIIPAYHLANEVIKAVMVQFVLETNNASKKEKEIFSLLNWLSGNTVNFENFFLKINAPQMA